MHSVTMPLLDPVALHGMQEPRREHRARRADRVSVRDRAAFDVDDVLGQTEVLRDGEGYGSEGLVDLDALDVADLPAGPVERLPHRRYRTQSEHARLDGADAIGDQARHRLQAFLLGPGPVGHDHGRSAGVEARRVAGRDRAVLAKGGLELG